MYVLLALIISLPMVGFCFILTAVFMAIPHPKYVDMPYEERISKARKYLLAGMALIIVPASLVLLILG